MVSETGVTVTETYRKRLKRVKANNNQQNNKNKEKENLSQEGLKQSESQIIMSAQEVEELKKRCCEAEIYLDKFLRLQAEFENVKKRLMREKEEFIKFAEASLILELIPIIEDFERALDATNKKEDIESLKKGIEIVVSHLKNLLTKRGLKTMEAIGKPFDPDLHEALLQEENDGYPENTVLEEYQKGYFLEDKVLRHAKVKTSKKKVI